MLKPHTVWQFFFIFIKRYRVQFFLMLLVGTLWSFTEAGLPYLLKIIIDQLASSKGDSSTLPLATMGCAVVYLLSVAGLEVGMRLEEYLKLKTIPLIRAEIRAYLVEYLQGHSFRFFQQNLSGSISKRIIDMTDSFRSLWDAYFWGLYPIILSVSLSSILMWTTYPLLSFFLISWFTTMVGGSAVLYQRALGYATQLAESENLLIGQINDRLRNVLAIKLFAQQGRESLNLQGYQNEEVSRSQLLSYYILRISIFRSVLCVILIGTLFLTLIYRWKLGLVTVGDFAFIMGSAFSVMRTSWDATERVSTAYREFGLAKQALTLLATPHEIKDLPEAKPLRVEKGEIRFENVTFRYYPSRPLFQDLSIHIPGGQKVGLVGFSGSGKTTFVNLVLRFFEVDQGRVLIDGQDIKEVTQGSLHHQIGVIPQEPLLFSRSILENIRYGRPEATEEEVMEAAKKAHCHDFILSLKDGYHTRVSEQGANLSVGQRRRITIARAILKDAPVLILDEVTSALDPVTERQIQESLHYVMQDRTALVIAHRLTTLADMDRILVFKEGKIVEEGSHSELLQLHGHYTLLWNMQSEGIIPHGVGKVKERKV